MALAYDSTVRLNQAYTSALISNFNYDDAALIAVAMPHYPLDTAFVATLLPESAPHFEKWRTEYLRNDHPSW